VHQESLTAIANTHGTDKGTIGPSETWRAHNYTDVYEAYLCKKRNQPIKLLEIGLGVKGEAWQANIVHGRNTVGGASLKMWYDYFPRARIYGVDINPASHIDNDRITTYIVDQGDVDALNGFLESIGNVKFDVIVDDGSHRPDHQQVSLGVLFPRLAPGGFYFIEDLLRNGKGDGKTSRSAVDTVVNTRRLLKGFQRDGFFEQPNALVNEAYLKRHIEFINFHVPRQSGRQNTEALCAIGKSGRVDHVADRLRHTRVGSKLAGLRRRPAARRV